MDGADPAAAFLATVTSTEPADLLEELRTAPQSTVEVRLREARAYLELGKPSTADRKLDELARTTDTFDRRWLIDWHRGLVALTTRDAKAARALFDTVYAAVPGEAAPKLAIALCAEAMGDHRVADRYYRIVWRTDRAYVSAAFGLARSLLALGERLEAVDVLSSVPETSSHYNAAQLAAVNARIRVPSATRPGRGRPGRGRQAARRPGAGAGAPRARVQRGAGHRTAMGAGRPGRGGHGARQRADGR